MPPPANGRGAALQHLRPASFGSDVLTCEPPILGEARWRLVLSDEEAWLAPETGDSADAGAGAEPAGLHFRLVSRTRSTRGVPSRDLLDTPWYPEEF